MTIAITGELNGTAETCRGRLARIAVVRFGHNLRSVLKVESGVPLLIVFLGIFFSLGLVVKLRVKYFGV